MEPDTDELTARRLYLTTNTMTADPAGHYRVVVEHNEEDPADDRQPLYGARWDDERQQLVLEGWPRA